jgi:hypothetical protein
LGWNHFKYNYMHARLPTSGTLNEILWLIPNNDATKIYRGQCAEVIARYQRGDPTLVDEIKRNNATTAANDGVPQFKAVQTVADVTDSVLTNTTKIETLERQLALKEREQALVDRQVACRERKRKLDLDDHKLAFDERRHRLVLSREEAIPRLATAHADAEQFRMKLLEDMGMLDDVKKFQIADRIQNYNPRKHMLYFAEHEVQGCASLAAAPQLEAVQAAQPGLPVGDQLMQVTEILEHVMDTDEITTKITQNAGKLVAAECRARYGEDFVFKSGNQRIQGRACKVKAYEAKDVPWILELLKSNLDLLRKECNTRSKKQKS